MRTPIALGFICFLWILSAVFFGSYLGIILMFVFGAATAFSAHEEIRDRGIN